MPPEPEAENYDPPDYGWKPNRFGRAVSPSERQLIHELAALHHLEVEDRCRAYLFRAPAWRGQVLRLSWGIVCWPRGEVLRGFAKAVGMMPLAPRYAGLHVKRLHGTDLVAFVFRVEHREGLLK